LIEVLAASMLAPQPLAAPRMTDMKDRKQALSITPRTILLALVAAFVLFCGGYQLGKHLALRENAAEAAGR